MSKNVVVLCVLLTVTFAMAIVPVSIRMRGLNPSLVGIVDDEYSDLYMNPATINWIEGARVYTNLSNIHNFGDDLFFDPTYSPDMYYNLIGGISSYKDHKIGAILETGGWNSIMTGSEYETEIIGNTTYVDTTIYEAVDKSINSALNLFWGKKISNYNVGVMFAPHMIDNKISETSTEIHYEYLNDDSLIDYSYNQDEVSSSEKGLIFPFIAGALWGEPENEMSAALTFGYEHENQAVPTKAIYSEVTHDITQTVSQFTEYFEDYEEVEKTSGILISLYGRNKRRAEDHAVSYVGMLTYVNEPMSMKYTDTIYDYQKSISGFYSGCYDKTVGLTKQEGKGGLSYIGFGLGVGYEKYFDAMNTNNLFAIAAIPSFFTGTAKMKMSPGYQNVNFWGNLGSYPDTLAYTGFGTNGEVFDIKNCFSGLNITLPVGLETNLTEKLCLRLGATEDIMFMQKYGYEMVMTDSGGKSVYTQTMPFDTVITNQEPSDELDSYTSKSESKTSFSNMTNYYFGAGYKINDNIELNFLNYAQLTDLRCWVLGVNIKF